MQGPFPLNIICLPASSPQKERAKPERILLVIGSAATASLGITNARTVSVTKSTSKAFMVTEKEFRAQ